MSTKKPRKLDRLMEDFESDTIIDFDAADMGTAFGMECSLAKDAERADCAGDDDEAGADWHLAPER
jgi:hypothetical protein